MHTLSGLQSRLNNSCKCRFRSKINLLLPRRKRDAEMLWLYREVTCNNKSFFSSDMWGHRHIVKQQERWWSVGEGFYFFPWQGLFSDLLYCCRYPIKSSALAYAFYLPFAWTTLLYGTTIISPPPREWFEAVFPTERCWTEIVFAVGTFSVLCYGVPMYKMRVF